MRRKIQYAISIPDLTSDKLILKKSAKRRV
jgi:hypothetical protein